MGNVINRKQELEKCQQCNKEIEGKPYFPQRDLTNNIHGNMTLMPDPDGPFCDKTCQEAFDNK